MAQAFARSLRSLHHDDGRGSAAVAAMAAVLGTAWVTWFVAADVTVYESTSMARLEVTRAIRNIDAPSSGRVVAVRAQLGQTVREGDVLLELDAEAHTRELAQQQARVAALEPEIEAIRRQIQAEETALLHDQAANAASIDEARARRAQASVEARYARSESRRAGRLHRGGALASADLSRTRSQARQARQTAAALRHEVRRLQQSQETALRRGEAHLEELRRELARLEGERATAMARVRVLEEAVSRQAVLAPASGRIGELAAIAAGSFVREGDRVGVVIPEGELEVVAHYLPPAALGRIVPGQVARVRLDGFPWARYGTLAAVVSDVASEPRYGRVRVELTLERDASSRMPLQHGLPGAVEIAIETVSPAQLALRTMGRWFSAPAGGGGQ